MSHDFKAMILCRHLTHTPELSSKKGIPPTTQVLIIDKGVEGQIGALLCCGIKGKGDSPALQGRKGAEACL